MRQGVVVARVAWVVVLSLAFSITLSASTLSGRWKTNLFLDIGKTGALLESDRWPSEIEMATELRVDGWTFANVTSFDPDLGLDIVKFAAAGPLGAFDVISSMTFDERYGNFMGLAAARAAIGGLELWGGAVLLWSDIVGAAGTGFVLGADGTVDNLEFYTDIAFNMEGMFSGPIIREGFDTMWDRLMLCNSLLEIGGMTCELPFSCLNVYTKVPLGCFDVETQTFFWWLTGFGVFDVWISDVDLGLGGLTLDRFEIFFTVDEKAILLDLGLRLAEIVCVTPYVTLVRDGPLDLEGPVDGLSIDALELIYTVGDVTFIASELFETVGGGPSRYLHVLGDDARIHWIDQLGVLGAFSECFVPVDANEAIGIEVDRGASCGSGFGLGIYAFFDTDLPGTSLFDWSETRVTVEYGTASNLTVSGSLNVDHEQVTCLGIALEFLWGDLVLFGPDWEAACCRVGFN